jgi:hypothetical protein
MSRWIRVGLKRELLRRHLARENGSSPTDNEIDQWLRDAGFEHRGKDQWLVRERDLGHLDPSEVSSVAVENRDDAAAVQVTVKGSTGISIS